MTPVEITTLLASLGGTADDVAESLRRMGVKGKRRECFNCPIARLTGADISEDWCALGDVMVGLPYAISSFIDCFDRGDYPDLVEK